MQVMRGAKRKGVRYFGPYAHAWAIRETSTCCCGSSRCAPARAGVFKRAGQIGRPCLLGYIDKCSAPCVGRVTAEEHREIVEDFCDFMAGKTDRVRPAAGAARCTRRPRELEFERAARLRDDIGALQPGAGEAGRGARRRHRRRRGRLRRGRARGRRAGLPRARRPGPRPARLGGRQGRGRRHRRAGRAVPAAALRRRGAATPIPREVLVPALPAGRRRRSSELARRRCGAAGSRCGCRSAATRGRCRRPSRATPMQALAQHKTQARRRPDHPQPGAGGDPGGARLDRARRCASSATTSRHVQGTEVVASHGGLRGRPGPQERVPPLRRSRASTGQNDVASMHEVITRRFRRLPRRAGRVRRARRTAPATGTTTGTRPMLVDPDDRPAAEVRLPAQPGRRRRRPAAGRRRPARRSTSSASTTSPSCGLAKRLEEVWLPGEEDPVILPRTSEGLYLLQRVRDEAHRFAITYHRQRRSKAHDVERAGRRPRAGRGAAQGAAQALRLA